MIIFPQINTYHREKIDSIILSFQFKSIAFSKKRVLPFFIAIELLSNQKCVVSLSRTNYLSWKIQKGMLVGCKVTLRSINIDIFIDMLNFTFSRMEKVQPALNYISGYYKKLNQLKYIMRPNSTYNITLNELVLFYPIELGLGLHPDVQKVLISFKFTTYSIEERFFFLRQSKVPVIFLI